LLFRSLDKLYFKRSLEDNLNGVVVSNADC
jgi:hypothetical protein